MLRLAILAAVTAISAAAGATDLVGHASVIDGDTIELHGQRIRLWGIDAPEGTQLCRGADSEHYRCGAAAANALAAYVGGTAIRCDPVGLDQYGRTVARCTAAGADLGEWLVGRGLAVDWPRYSHRHYAAPQRDAELSSRGIWSGSFIEPWRYRACIRKGGRPAECSDGTRLP
jgi:endonuclease YncB( thermonuclease family)